MAKIRKTSGSRGVVTNFPKQAARAMKPQSPGSGGASDGVDTTDNAGERVRLVSDASAPRIEELRRQIEDGKYEPDARQIAERLLEKGFRR